MGRAKHIACIDWIEVNVQYEHYTLASVRDETELVTVDARHNKRWVPQSAWNGLVAGPTVRGAA